MSSTKHYESTKDVEMDESGQYVGTTSSDFKIASPTKSAKIKPVKTKFPIKTANLYQNLMDLEDQVNETSLPKVTIPAINLKINDDYNLTPKEIKRNFPSTENKYDRRGCRHLIVETQLHDQKVAGLKPDSAKEPPCEQATPNPSKVKHPPILSGRSSKKEVPAQLSSSLSDHG
ncbi:hypothetical protein AVEN_21002-1 [Araneus ventricosus]|uniref:Uncharacterized protein n=1 Tax=Araneus ventricosus TaxID=182803 RepID=A0A4Y2D658_ARAVE|nr:hypothetical protein AVEN_21002-1 [Araneus ventricosus]